MSFGTTGIKLGSNFSVNANGDLTANSGKMGGWNLRYDSTKKLYGLFTDDNSIGLFSSGSVKEYHEQKRTLSGGYLKVGNFYALSNGTIQGGMSSEKGVAPQYSTWSITKEGVATFNNATINKGYLAADSIQTVINGTNRGMMSSFFAESATVNNLSANVANISKLVADKASIESLNAVDAKINNLSAVALTTSTLKAALARIGYINVEGISSQGGITSSGTVYGNIIKGTSFQTGGGTFGAGGSVGGLRFSAGLCT